MHVDDVIVIMADASEIEAIGIILKVRNGRYPHHCSLLDNCALSQLCPDVMTV